MREPVLSTKWTCLFATWYQAHCSKSNSTVKYLRHIEEFNSKSTTRGVHKIYYNKQTILWTRNGNPIDHKRLYHLGQTTGSRSRPSADQVWYSVRSLFASGRLGTQPEPSGFSITEVLRSHNPPNPWTYIRCRRPQSAVPQLQPRRGGPEPTWWGHSGVGNAWAEISATHGWPAFRNDTGGPVLFAVQRRLQWESSPCVIGKTPMAKYSPVPK